jgi:pre-mRNA-splicing factor CDC5/CEF1
MPTVKGGVWENAEDEVLKAAISKYGLNQWARVSSLLKSKTAKQCKARWEEWLDPAIRKVEWSREEDEKLLHLAKLMPTQWRTIASRVGRTANQCLDRYNRLLDDAQAKEDAELGLMGVGTEAGAPSADDVRKLRPGEVDPDPETKPARPDTIDLDEDVKEMLSEARARLANTQGKKAKRKARERQLEESRRIANLQKRRELKQSGISTKLRVFKKGEMDYNADIPFEKAPVPGFYDTTEEQTQNEAEREAYDPRKQQLAIKRKGAPEDENGDPKRRKGEKNPDPGFEAAKKAAQLQKLRDAERMSKRKGLALPAPQVSDTELEMIVKMGLSGERIASGADEYGTRGLIGGYSNLPTATPIRTPRAPQEEDRIANELANIRALNETQSALLGGDNAALIEGEGSTGFQGIQPSKHVSSTPNPMATPFRQPNGMSATPFRTPRDNLNLNRETGLARVGETPRDIKLREKSIRHDLLSKLAALPKPKESEWELELPDEKDEVLTTEASQKEDAAIRDQREARIREAAEKKEFAAQSMVVQKRLPLPHDLDIKAMLKNAKSIDDPIRRAVRMEAAVLMANDAARFGGAKIKDASKPRKVDPSELDKARLAVAKELGTVYKPSTEQFGKAWESLHSSGKIPGLDGYYEDEIDEHEMIVEEFDDLQSSILSSAEKGSELEKKLSKIHGGYLARSKAIKNKTTEVLESLIKARVELNTSLDAQTKESAAMSRRLDQLREEVAFVSRKEREEQEEYRKVRDELNDLQLGPKTNGTH